MRKLFGTLVGILVAIAIVSIVQWLAAIAWPLPVVESADRGVLAQSLRDLPLSAKLLFAIARIAGTFGGGWLALRIGDWRPSAWIVALVVIAGTFVNLLTLPYPEWVGLAAVAAPILGAWLAWRFHRKPYAGEALLG